MSDPFSHSSLEREVVDEIEARFGRFIREKVNPGAAVRDEQHQTYPVELLREAGEIGLLSYGLPREFGGVAPTRAHYGIAIEHLGYLCEDAGFTVLLAFRSSMIKALIESERPLLIDRYVRPMCRGAMFPAFAYTEDAEPTRFKTTAELLPDGRLRVNGLKRPVLGGETAKAAIVYCRLGEDIVCVLVERDDPGVEFIPIKVGALRSNGPCALRLTDVVVPPERILASQDGLSHAQRSLNDRRLDLACAQLGRLRAMMEHCVRLLSATTRYGQPLTEMPVVQAHLGRMHVALLSARVMARYAQQHATEDFNAYWDPVITAAKHFLTEQCNHVVMEAFRPLATHGYIDLAFTRFQRDFAMMITISGTQDSTEVNLGAWAVREAELAAARAGARPGR